MNIDSILQEVLKKIIPNEEENLERKKIAKEIINKIKSYGYDAEIVGSLAKDTNLRDDFDIDIFVKFPPGTDKKILEEKIIEIGKKILENFEIDYAEHPYIKGKFKNNNIEIVPCYDFGNEIFGKFKNIATAVDRTIYHTKFVKEEIKKNPKLSNEIRILKKFLKGINVYGAEGKISGFSGYLAELLIIYYGSFLNLLKNASSWRYNEFIDIKNYWKGKGKVLFNEPLVVIDPVDDTRNVAAAVSEENLAKFIFYSREFLENPSIKFFENIEDIEIKTEELINAIKERETKFLSVVFNHGKINLNNLYTQLEKTRKALVKSVERYEFKILNSGIFTNEKNLSIIFFEFYIFSLPKVEKRIGPRLDNDIENQKKFLKTYKNVKIEGFNFVSIRERKFKNVNNLMEFLITKKEGFGKEFLNLEGKIYEDEKIFEILKGEDLENFKKIVKKSLMI